MEAENRSRATTLTELLSAATNRHPDQTGADRARGTGWHAHLRRAVRGIGGAQPASSASRGVGRGDVVGGVAPQLERDGRVGVRARCARRRDARRQHALRRHRVGAPPGARSARGVVAPARFLDLDFAGRLRRASDAAPATAAAPWVALTRPSGSDDLARFDIGGGTWTPTSVPRDARPRASRSRTTVGRAIRSTTSPRRARPDCRSSPGTTSAASPPTASTSPRRWT